MICTARFRKQTEILWSIIALLLIPAFSEARVISVQMSAPTIAFGGYSWPGVGQYEKITGVAYAEVDPADRRNASSSISGLPSRRPSRAARQDSRRQSRILIKLLYSQAGQLEPGRSKLNGYGKMMYEPPNRGGKTGPPWAASPAAVTTRPPLRTRRYSRTHS